ncbi:hypothetical protein BDR04DRAFT_1092347 [Suillus decipiens]|nr:hypothetical protein BDR04DRAFT_1092347 [Suillus decipiens]
MTTQGDLERADPGPSFDSQRDEKVPRKTHKNAVDTTTAEHSALVSAWMQRLQTLTVITAFLTSIDGQLFTLTSRTSEVTLNASDRSEELVYACLAGALIFHVCSSILGYAASFLVIRYEVIDAESPSIVKTDAQGKRSNTHIHHLESIHGKQLLFKAFPPLYAVQSLFPTHSGVRLHSRTTPPLDLLTRCYYTVLALSGAGFILALIGIATYAWFGLQQVVGIFTIACLGVSLFVCMCAVVY